MLHASQAPITSTASTQLAPRAAMDHIAIPLAIDVSRETLGVVQ
jgi:hypothetical protein